MIKELEKKLKEKENPEKAKILQRFFKTGKGEYGEGDIFLGLAVGEQRKIAKEFKYLDIENIQTLLDSKVHEKRLIGLLILIEKYNKGDEIEKDKLFNFYLNNAKKVNNWDLVDLTASRIVGDYLLKRDRGILYILANSDNLWEKRISIISTWVFIRNKDFKDCLKISKILLKDKHDLIHKAVGWMLREVGKKDEKVLENFLKENYKEMPRTMLRYAIEKFEENKRQRYLKGEV